MPQFDVHFFSSLIFWEVVSFGILLWVLYKFAFPPILEALETRERKIRDSIEQAEQNRLTAEQRLADYEAKLNGAAQEAEAIVADAKAKAQRLLEENEQRLRTESERIQAETTQEIERERRKALQDIRNEAADLALTVAEKVLARSLSDDDHRRLAREAVQAVAAGESQK
ncbi:MAG: F0F1 ATP synthase subunit B [Nitrospira sp. SB0672_bin_25]|nr:F0F1 ATP synthase subunit B [Nitrospira sp. SB0666_bin_27]MYF25724.1 F0F1 ATP synthase subunit B [Nitrospira sp. SB0678_bin_10]MYJ53886.1 F0F1 ATP synthase subunit B [Nitrospira sp. SB0672_bin_25]